MVSYREAILLLKPEVLESELRQSLFLSCSVLLEKLLSSFEAIYVPSSFFSSFPSCHGLTSIPDMASAAFVSLKSPPSSPERSSVLKSHLLMLFKYLCDTHYSKSWVQPKSSVKPCKSKESNKEYRDFQMMPEVRLKRHLSTIQWVKWSLESTKLYR